MFLAMKRISLITPVLNEEENILKLVENAKKVMQKESAYLFEHVFIDNGSDDKTIEIIKNIIKTNKHIGLIKNRRNFGPSRSPFYALRTVDSDAAILMSADMQEPLELIPEFLKKWEQGHLVVGGIKKTSDENFFMFKARSIYYKVLSSISEVKPVAGFTGFALYDAKVLERFREMNDIYPYIRGLPSDLGFEIEQIEFHQPPREQGKSKVNFLLLIEVAMTGLTSHSKAPIRIASIMGATIATISIIVGLVYLALKLLNWDSFELGLAPILVFMTFTFAMQILFLGLIGEYIAKINTQVTKRPLVVEERRSNYPIKEYLNQKK
jgi:polyisoprenyl-phosphate glycosyltransferase